VGTVVSMSTAMDLPLVEQCSVSSCSYNADSACHAGAITVAGEHAACGTFVEISFRAGTERTGKVGACHRTECKHNEALACAAGAIAVGAGDDVADCLTYSPK
jgi:hypothetical protein